MPDIESEAYLIQLWQDAGVVETSGMGITKLSWKEIEAWLRVRRIRGDIPLTAWEIDTVRRLSEEYAGEYSAASSKDRPAPYEIEREDQLDRVALTSKFKSIFSQFKKSDDTAGVVEED